MVSFYLLKTPGMKLPDGMTATHSEFPGPPEDEGEVMLVEVEQEVLNFWVLGLTVWITEDPTSGWWKWEHTPHHTH